MNDKIVLDIEDIRAVTAYAADCAAEILSIFEQAYPFDTRPRVAIEAARKFARVGKREKALRAAAWDALKAAQETETAAASHAARAAMSASAAAFLHPLAHSSQVRHILGAAAHAARAAELAAGGAPAVGADWVASQSRRASPKLIEVLRRYPAAPPGGGRTGELLRILDQTLRSLSTQID
jgi:hypothetical protein